MDGATRPEEHNKQTIERSANGATKQTSNKRPVFRSQPEPTR